MVCLSFLHYTSLCIPRDKNLGEFLMLCFVLWVLCCSFLSIKIYVCTWVDLLFVNNTLLVNPNMYIHKFKLLELLDKINVILNIELFCNSTKKEHNLFKCFNTKFWLWRLMLITKCLISIKKMLQVLLIWGKKIRRGSQSDIDKEYPKWAWVDYKLQDFQFLRRWGNSW